ncbi:hypothetical protein [Streptomyces roseolus]|uniref:hypothetical protein n=1 Tax=Streptomyces roseolus TaxID=67358 RepID=UPI001679B9D5|nr:hypothetical protein [Streptomyces roseolus]GGR18087.1 hypothetical protein GCM10010282_07790 [Streptomyces roseolus]
MSELFDAAFGLPAIVLTSALVAVAGFWSLVLCRVVSPDAFDADLDMEALGFGDVSVSPAGTVFIAVGWVLDLSGMVLLGRAGLPGLWSLLLSLVLLVAALTVSWRLTRWLAGRVRKRPAATRRARRRGAASGPRPARSAA